MKVTGVVLVMLSLLVIGDPAYAAGETGKGGASCTWELCMKRCIENVSKFCNAYCEKTLKERKLNGVCK